VDNFSWQVGKLARGQGVVSRTYKTERRSRDRNLPVSPCHPVTYPLIFNWGAALERSAINPSLSAR